MALRTPTPARAKHVGKQFATAVDHRRLLGELGRAVDHAEDLDYPADAVEAAQSFPQRCQEFKPTNCAAL